jgi:hypothetical protein
VARLALLVLQELRVATKAKVLELKGDLVKVKINTATINKATVEGETSAEVEGVEEAGNTLESKTVAFMTALENKNPGV